MSEISSINYTSRDYESILSDFLGVVSKLTDLWKPEASADPGVVLGKILASAADMLGINLDKLANEIFGPSVSQRKNAEKLFGLIGYELGWYTAARTEVTFKNNSDEPIKLDFGFSGNNFCTLNAYTDIAQQPRVITYNILPRTNKYGAKDTRSRRQTLSTAVNVFDDTDIVTLQPGGDPITRVAIEGELRSYSIPVSQVISNNYIIKLPSQHLDTTAVWIKAKTSLSADDFDSRQWVQVNSPSEFLTPEPRFAVNYDNYSNAQIQISSYLSKLEDYDGYYLIVYWIDCSGVIGSVGTDVLNNFLPAKQSSDGSFNDASMIENLTISNLSNTVELPNTHAITGKSPETAKQAYFNSRNYINTWDSLSTLPDFNRFLNREPGVDCGLVIDCQKALDINLAIYNNPTLTASQKSKMYITNNDFPAGDTFKLDWGGVLGLGFDPTEPQKFVFSANFQRNTAMCFCVHNDFKPSNFGTGRVSTAQIRSSSKFIQYKPPIDFVNAVIRDYRPLQVMSVVLQFGFLRVFPWYAVGVITPKNPVSQDVGNNIIQKVKEALSIYFAPANRSIGQMPTLMEIVEIVEGADPRIRHFDPGSLKVPGIVWNNVDIDFFNPISFAQYSDPSTIESIIINPEYLNS